MLEKSGFVYAMGCNNFGQLGIFNESDSNINLPTLVIELKKYKTTKIACGHYHSAAIVENWKLFTWGYGMDGALGHGSQQSYSAPKLVEYFWLAPWMILDVSCGKDHTGVILWTQSASKQQANDKNAKFSRSSSTKIFLWGNDEYGQLGNNSTSLMEVYPKEVKIDDIPIQISCGINFTLLLTENGKVYSWGDNSEHQLGNGKKSNSSKFYLIKSLDGIPISKISAGSHSMAISDQGWLMVWGKTSIGLYDFPESISNLNGSIIDCSVGSYYSVALDSYKKVWLINSPDSKSEPEIISNLHSK